MTKKSSNYLLIFSLSILISLSFVACDGSNNKALDSNQEADKLELIYEFVMNEPPEIGVWGGLTIYEGGFSGIYYIPNTEFEFYIINDRGLNIPIEDSAVGKGKEIKVFPFPDYAQKLIRVKGLKNEIVIKEVLPLKKSENQTLNGLPIPFSLQSHEEVAWSDFEGTTIPHSKLGVDIEALVFENDSIFWFAEEYRPSVWCMNKNTGEAVKVYAPFQEDENSYTLPEVLKNRRPNRAFEAIAYTPDKKIYALLQSAMWNPDKSMEKKSRLSRLIQINPESNEVKTFIYEMNDAKADVRIKDWKIGDMVAIDENRFLVLEHGNKKKDIYIDVYLIDISQATDIVNEPTNNKTIESYETAENLNEKTGIKSVQKTHLFDLLAAGYNPDLGKPEGMTMIGDSLLVLLNDNDYSIDVDKQNNLFSNNIKTQISIFRIPKQLRFNKVNKF
jgi:hypothetical protein